MNKTIPHLRIPLPVASSTRASLSVSSRRPPALHAKLLLLYENETTKILRLWENIPRSSRGALCCCGVNSIISRWQRSVRASCNIVILPHCRCFELGRQANQVAVQDLVNRSNVHSLLTFFSCKTTRIPAVLFAYHK